MGARRFLVAYNIYFNSSDVAMVRALARQIRAESGGLKGVKAMGVLAHGRAQLAPVVTDVAQRPLRHRGGRTPGWYPAADGAGLG